MKRIFVLVSIFMLLQVASNAQNSQSLLWRISGKGMSKPSFLFGTIHLICPSDYLWTDKMKQSLDASDKVCFEMDLDDNKVMMSASEGFIDNSGKKLKEYFTPVQYEILKKFVKDSIGMDIILFQSMKPVALESVISMKATKCIDPVSYEETIMKTAKANNKEVLGLEDPSEQISVLDNAPADTVVKEIMDEIANFGKNKQEYNDMVNAYKAQQLLTLYGMITGSKGLGDNMDLYLDDRNKRWIEMMTGKMKNCTVFFAVGAGHLPGDNGVINLLRKAGYTVEPVL